MTANYLGMKDEPRDPAEGDFYPTPPGATLALLQVEDFPGVIWEPACGAGDISKVLIEMGHGPVISSDLFDRGYGMTGKDFFSFSYMLGASRHIITNPPFKSINAAGTKVVTTDWINKIATLPGLEKAALFMKTTALAGQKRSRALEKAGFCRLLQFRGRVKCEKGKLADKNDNGSMMEFAWFIFERGFQGEPTIHWIDEVTPGDLAQIPMFKDDEDD